MIASITRDDWLNALKEAESPGDQEAVTASEFAALVGIHRSTAGAKLQRLVALGKATATRKRIQDGSGRSQMVAAYRLVKGEAPKGKKR